MVVLNLVDLDKSNVKYKVSKFPDGQQNIVISGVPCFLGGGLERGFSLTFNKVKIESRLNNWLDLELIICAVASLRELNSEFKIHLYVPYIMGARSDRKFEEGGNNYLRDVICPIINSLNFKTVTCIDPHSDVLEACIKGFRKESNLNLLLYSLGQIYKDLSLNQFILVSSDAGASKKIYKLAEQIGYKGDIITCSKDRDVDGKLTKTVVPVTFEQLKSEKDFIIIDDICDGGATFINIAKAIKNERKSAKTYLIVTHGIFSKSFEELSKYFDGIYCTNSYRQINNSLNFGASKDFVKQLNVF